MLMNKKCYSGDIIQYLGPHNHLRDSQIINQMHLLNENSQGTNFVLAARDQFGSIGLYPRWNQPCQGGEFRKYFDSNVNDKFAKPHGDLAVDKKVKPIDLYDPFPSGELVAFGTNMYKGAISTFTLTYLLSNDSPWVDAFGDEKCVEIREHSKGQSVVIKTTDIDASVWMQLLWNIKMSYFANFDVWVSEGFTKREAALLCILMGNTHLTSSIAYHGAGCSSYTPISSFNIHRFLTQSPYHLLGDRTFRKGGDYRRSHGRGTVGAEACWQDRQGKVGYNYQAVVYNPNGGPGKISQYNTKEKLAGYFREVIDEWNTPEKGHMVEVVNEPIPGDGGTVFIEEEEAA